VGSLVIAAAVVGTSPAPATASTGPTGVEERVQQAREALRPGAGFLKGKQDALDELAFWGNRIGIGVGVRPVWPNWPNWNNWHNWPNGWGNGGWANL
jgi:hypothetical protein